MQRQLIPVQFKQVWMALDANQVQEVMGPRSWLPIPGASARIPGVLSWRGRAIAVVDLGMLTGVDEPLTPGQARERTVVLQHGGATLAVLADSVREVAHVPEENIRTAHAARQRYASHEVELHGTPMPVLELASLIEAIATEGV